MIIRINCGFMSMESLLNWMLQNVRVRKCMKCLTDLANYFIIQQMGLSLICWECFMGKTGLLKHGRSGPRRLLRNSLLMEMKVKDYKKIVLVAHSQGTIITGNVIADFNDMVENVENTAEEREAIKENMSKLEVYMIAGAGHLCVWKVCKSS